MSRHPVSHVRIVLEALKLEGSPAAASGPVAFAAPTSKAATDYAAERAAVTALADALAAHPKTARIAAQKNAIAAQLATAAALALKNDWPAAMAQLGAARTACVAAKKLADDWKTFGEQRASMEARMTAIAGFGDAADVAVQAASVALATADGQAGASPANFAAAKQTLDAAAAAMSGWFDGTVSEIRALLANLQSLAPGAKAFVAKEIAEGTKLLAQAEAALAAQAWSRVMMCYRTAVDAMAPAERYGQRRVGYETQRATTAADILKLKAQPTLKDHGPALDALLAKADGLASHAQLKVEEGVKVLQELSKRCDALLQGVPLAVSHDTERAAADNELALLAKHSAATQIAEPLAAIRKQLAAAAASATQARANVVDARALWQTALTQVQGARADLAATQALADKLGPASTARAAATGGDAAAMRKALNALQADLAAASKAAHADLAKKPLALGVVKATAADKALTQKDLKAAAIALLEASKALAEARTVQSQHAQFESTLVALDARLKALHALPTAKSIDAKIQAVAKAIAAAKLQDKKAEGEAAMAALRVATGVAAAADQADVDRRVFDTEAKRVAERIKTEVTDAKLKKTVNKIAEEAAKQAAAFKFTEAGKTLKRAEVEIANLKLRAGMKTTPPDPNLEAIAKQMVADGGAASVDKAIQDSPEGNPDVILALASGRYGKPFKFDDAATGPQQVKSMKRICQILEKIPDDVANNPSVLDVSHATSADVGGGNGWYSSSTAHIQLDGQVGGEQKFGTDEVTYDPNTQKAVKALPKNIDPDCQAKGGKKAEYLGFTAAHEVGHGVDDKRGFMDQRGSGEEYGGWITYGAECQPVADAVGQHIAAQHPASSFYKTPESKRYLLDKLMNKPATRPVAADGTPDAKALAAFDKWHRLATADNVYGRQADCDAIQIGDRIYHEAYARSWVSYKAAARRKGLTSYQFRAPGEWFAELYAGWKTGKLGPKHPALKWLKEL
jgi:hypothetical protein